MSAAPETTIVPVEAAPAAEASTTAATPVAVVEEAKAAVVEEVKATVDETPAAAESADVTKPAAEEAKTDAVAAPVAVAETKEEASAPAPAPEAKDEVAEKKEEAAATTTPKKEKRASFFNFNKFIAGLKEKSAKTQKPAKKTEEKAVEEDKPAEPKVEEAAKPEEAKTEEVAPVAEKKVEKAKPEEVKEAAAPVAAVEAPAAEQAKPATEEVKPTEGVKIDSEKMDAAAPNKDKLGRRLSLKVGQIRGNLFAKAKKVVEDAHKEKKAAPAKTEEVEVVSEKAPEPVAPAVAEIPKTEEKTPVVSASA